jgi:hypothetical protein
MFPYSGPGRCPSAEGKAPPGLTSCDDCCRVVAAGYPKNGSHEIDVPLHCSIGLFTAAANHLTAPKQNPLVDLERRHHWLS